MKKVVLLTAVLGAAVLAFAETTAYLATAKNTPQTGLSGKVESVQFASTNATGSATVSAVTDLSVNGVVHSFTNTIATATLTNGVAAVTPTNVYVSPNQRIIVSGTAFPGGSATLWITK